MLKSGWVAFSLVPLTRVLHGTRDSDTPFAGQPVAIRVNDIERSSPCDTACSPTGTLYMAMAIVLLGHLPRTSRYGIYGSCRGGIFWTSGRQVAVVPNCYRHGPVLQRMVLC